MGLVTLQTHAFPLLSPEFIALVKREFSAIPSVRRLYLTKCRYPLSGVSYDRAIREHLYSYTVYVHVCYNDWEGEDFERSLVAQKVLTDFIAGSGIPQGFDDVLLDWAGGGADPHVPGRKTIGMTDRRLVYRKGAVT